MNFEIEDRMNEQHQMETDLFRRAADILTDAKTRPITEDEAYLLQYLIGL